MSNMFRYVAAVLLAITPSLLTAQQKPVSGPSPSGAALTALVDSVVTASLLSQGVPSVSVVVVRGGETLVERAWRQADVASGRAADASTYAVPALGPETAITFLADPQGRVVGFQVLAEGNSNAPAEDPLSAGTRAERLPGSS